MKVALDNPDGDEMSMVNMKLTTDADDNVFASSLHPDAKSGYSGTKDSSNIKMNLSEITPGNNAI